MSDWEGGNLYYEAAQEKEAKQRGEMEEYEDILEMERKILANTHPRIRLDPALLPALRAKAEAEGRPQIWVPSLSPVTFAGTQDRPVKQEEFIDVDMQELSIQSPVDVQTLLGPTHADVGDVRVDFMKNYYKRLGVERHCSGDAIQRGYNHKVLNFSPDSQSAEARQKWKRRALETATSWAEIKFAYKVLGDSGLKHCYDEGHARLRAAKEFANSRYL